MFSKQLINKYKQYMREKHGKDYSDEEATQHLDSLAIFLIMRGGHPALLKYIYLVTPHIF